MTKHITMILDDALKDYENQCSVSRQWSLGDEVRALRERLKLSQAEFSQRYAIPIGNLQNWEQASRGTRPDAAARLLIKMIKADPDRVAEIVNRTRFDEGQQNDRVRRQIAGGAVHNKNRPGG